MINPSADSSVMFLVIGESVPDPPDVVPKMEIDQLYSPGVKAVLTRSPPSGGGAMYRCNRRGYIMTFSANSLSDTPSQTPVGARILDGSTLFNLVKSPDISVQTTKMYLVLYG
jgi:hypothetical protein